MLVLWLALASPPAIVAEGAIVFSQCDPASEKLGRLEGGTPVKLGFSISGDHGRCFSVAAGGLQGYVFASSITTLEEYEKARITASVSDNELPLMIRAEIRKMREEAPAHPLLVPVLDAMDSGRPALALSRIESDLLPKAPEDPNLLALAGLAAFQADDTRKAESYWSRSLALRANPQIAALLARVRAEREADAGHHKTSTSRFVLRYDGKALASHAAASLLSVLDSELDRIDAALGCPSAEPLTVIVQTQSAYRTATGMGEWNGGLFDGRIRVPLFDGAQPQELRRTLAHELVHACLARRGIRERWLHEGLAMRWSGERPPDHLLREAQKLDRPPEWDESKPEQVRLYYAWAWLAVDRLYQNRGESGVRELLRNPASLPAPAIR
jgi:hypothetical protein